MLIDLEQGSQIQISFSKIVQKYYFFLLAAFRIEWQRDLFCNSDPPPSGRDPCPDLEKNSFKCKSKIIQIKKCLSYLTFKSGKYNNYVSSASSVKYKIVQWTPLNGITLGQTITDPINQMIPDFKAMESDFKPSCYYN